MHFVRGAESKSPEFGFWTEVGVFLLRETRLDSTRLFHQVKNNFLLQSLNLAQFNLRLKLCMYTIVHLLLEESRFYLKSSSSIQTLCPGVALIFGPESESPGFLGPESESESHKK